MTTSSVALPPSLRFLVDALSREVHPSADRVASMVSNAGVRSTELEPWADFEHPVSDSYGRQLVHHGGHFEIMVMAWVPGDYSAIHDHGQAEWGAVQCFGEADHHTYRLNNSVLSLEREVPYYPGMIQPVTPWLIHQMGNPGPDPFLSLHVYGIGSSTLNVTGEARIFELHEHCIQRTDGGVFFALPEDQILRREPGLEADPAVTLRHHHLKRDRLSRILAHQWSSDLYGRIQSLEGAIDALKHLAETRTLLI